MTNRLIKKGFIAIFLASLFSGVACTERDNLRPQGNSEGFLGVVSINYDNARAHCNVEDQGSNHFKTVCVAIAADNQGNEIRATRIAEGLQLTWLDPTQVFGATIQNQSCSVAPDGLSQRCAITLSQDLPTKILFQLRVVDTLAMREKTESFATTIALPDDTQAPAYPENVRASSVSLSQIDLSWNASTDNVGVEGYRIYRDGEAQPFATITALQYSVNGLEAGKSYTFQIAAYDVAGNMSLLSPPVTGATLEDPLASAKIIIDDFTQVQYIESNAVNGDGQDTYTWNPEHTVVLSERMRDRGIEQKTLFESGLDPTRVLGGGRLIQFNQTELFSAVYLAIGQRYMSFGNDNADPTPNVDTVSLGYHGAIDRGQIDEVVLSLHSIDSIGSNFILKVSDGVNNASLLYENTQRGSISREIVFPFSQMSGMSALAPTIISVELTMTSGGYGLDGGIQGLFAR